METSGVTPPGEPTLAAELRSSALLFGLVIGTTALTAAGAQLLVRTLS